MEIIIVGAGKVGYAVAQQLCSEGHSITVVDRSPARIELISGSLDVNAICDEAGIDSLRLAGAASADLLLAVTDSDESNILCCMTARKLGVTHAAARVRRADRAREVYLLRQELGLSMTINPDQAAAREISRVLRFPSASMVEPFASGQAELVEFTLTASNPLCGLALKDLHGVYGRGILICSVRRGVTVQIPGGDFVLCAGDVVSVVGAPKEIYGFFRAMAIFKRSVRRVMILGGSRIARYLAGQLLDMGLHVKIVEQDEDKCDQIIDALPKAEICCANGAKPDALREEGIDEADAFVALTGSDETNLIMAAWAKSQGVEKVVCKVNEAYFLPLAASFGLDEPVRPSYIAAQQILRNVRGLENSADASGLESLRRIVDGKLEALEFLARDGSRCLNTSLQVLPIRSGVLVAAIIRNGRCFIPGGSDCIQSGDRVIAVSGHMGIRALEDILEG